MTQKKTILVAPLHWGLGHATRCIPIIRTLLQKNYNVLIASDGGALKLLKHEFPNLPSLTLPSYDIQYPKSGWWFKTKMMFQYPKIKKAIRAEQEMIASLVSDGTIDGIISDNRFGVYSEYIPSVFMTHQLNVLSGSTSMISSNMHQQFVKKYDQCWVPDVKGPMNLSGRLGHPNTISKNVKYIGVLSRMKPQALPVKYDVLALLSGPEPQRTLLEMKLMEAFLGSDKKVLMVRGVVETQSQSLQKENITIHNFMSSQQLEQAINESEIVVARSGYTTIMDLALMNKRAFFIPTPGQYEQIYLAERLKEQGVIPSCNQENFSLKKLEKVPFYSGFDHQELAQDLSPLFGLFEGE